MKKLVHLGFAITLAFSTTNLINAQKVFFGGGSNPMMPIANYQNYYYQNSIMGGHSGQVQEVVSNSDGAKIYFQAQNAQTLENKIYKLDAATQAYEGEFIAKSYSRNLKITNNNNYLMYQTTSMLYKADALTMTLVDSIPLTTFISNILVFDENTVYCNSLGSIFKADFISHAFVDTVQFSGNGRMAFNGTKTKLFAIQETPAQLGVIGLSSFAVDTVLALQNNSGKPEDVRAHLNKVFVKSFGFNGNSGTLKVLDSSTLMDVVDISIPPGTGYLNISPNEKLWVPCAAGQEIVIVDVANNTIDTTLSVFDYNNLTSCYTVAFSNAIITSVKPVSNLSESRVYPNPNSGTLFFSTLELERVKVYNSTGQLLNTIVESTNRIVINEPSGVYFLLLETKKGDSHWKKVIIQ